MLSEDRDDLRHIWAQLSAIVHCVLVLIKAPPPLHWVGFILCAYLEVPGSSRLNIPLCLDPVGIRDLSPQCSRGLTSLVHPISFHTPAS